MCVYVFVVDDNVRTILSEKYVIGVSDYFKLWLILHIFVEYLANYKISTKSRFYIVFCHLLQSFRELIILQSRVATVHSSHHAIIYCILYVIVVAVIAYCTSSAVCCCNAVHVSIKVYFVSLFVGYSLESSCVPVFFSYSLCLFSF